MKFVFTVCLLCLATPLHAQDDLADLPRNGDEPSFEIEPPLLIQERGLEDPLPEATPATPLTLAEVNLEQLEADLAKAKKNALSGERLFKAGIIAKVQAEERALKVLRLEAELSNARLEQAKAELKNLQSRLGIGEISKVEVESAESEVVKATTVAEAAAANRHRAELEAAQLNLSRQQKLLASGSGRKADVNRALEKLAALKQREN